MNDYINRQELLSKTRFCEAVDEHIVYMSDVLHTPAADVKEVKQGYWIERIFEIESDSVNCIKVECSACNTHWDNATNFCPHCGAEMDKEKEQ